MSKVESISCDLLVAGANPCGVACAVTTARNGLSVVMTTHNPVLGGMIANAFEWAECWGFLKLCPGLPGHGMIKFKKDKG